MSLKTKLLLWAGKKIISKFDETITKAGFKEEGGGLVTHKGVKGLLPFIVLTAEVIDSSITSGPSKPTKVEPLKVPSTSSTPELSAPSVDESLGVEGPSPSLFDTTEITVPPLSSSAPTLPEISISESEPPTPSNSKPSVSISTKGDKKPSAPVQTQPMAGLEKLTPPPTVTESVKGLQTAPTYSQHMVPHIKKWEGGFVNDPDDTGGATNMGITIKTFRGFYGEERTVEDLKNITEEQWHYIFKKGYWDLTKADRIKNQSVAELIVGWVWGSGPGNAFPPLYRIFNMPVKTHMSEELLAKINSSNQAWLHKQIWEAKKNYFYHICEIRPKNQKFLKGWLKRLNTYVFVPSIYDPEYNAEPAKEPPIVLEQYSSIEDSPYNYQR